jgi:hypothetical protein
MPRFHSPPAWPAALASGLLLVLSACDDNPAADGDDAVCDHVDADGLVVENADTLVAAQWQGKVTGDIAAGAGVLGPPLTVTFLDEDSTRVAIPAACVDHRLGIEFTDPGIAQVEERGRPLFASGSGTGITPISPPNRSPSTSGTARWRRRAW